MFTRPLFGYDPNKATKIPDPAAPQYRMSDYGYGKMAVKVFQAKRDGPVHEVIEFKVTSLMRLNTHKEYYNCDNSDIVGSDVQASTIYVHAQKYGLTTPEEFALSVTQHFLDTYDQAEESNIIVENMPWDRLGGGKTNEAYGGKPHNHVFTRDENETRYCEVVRKRGEQQPLLIGGIRGLRILKTAKASFIGYTKGKLFTEGDTPDRILCVGLDAKWQYSQVDNIDFATHWYKIRELILQAYAGDSTKGEQITCVQYAAYKAGRLILDTIPEICSVFVDFLNYSYFPYDLSRFPPIEPKANVLIIDPIDEPLSKGYARVDRHQNIEHNNDGLKNIKSKY